jgi:primosomal protein N' (replication factor Y)
MRLVDVAVPVPLGQAFTYEVPEALDEKLQPGARAVVPFGSRKLVAVVLERREGEPPKGVKRVLSAPDDAPSLPADLLAFLRDLASYYFAPIGDVLKLALPPIERATQQEIETPSLFGPAKGVAPRQVAWVVALDAPAPAKSSAQALSLLAHVRGTGPSPLSRLCERWGSARAIVKRLADAGALAIELREAARDPFFTAPVARDAPPELTGPQAEAVARLEAAVAAGAARTFLLHGVTGSGKTEVYLHAIAAVRAAGRGALVLVPEIALTPQLVSRFRARFGDEVAVIHSALTDKERWLMWQRLRKGELDVAIGARSALFAPVRDLGLVIVDEEHDGSFKQEEGVRYHARDMAILRAHKSGGVCVLGSATPSLESELLTRGKKAEKLRLPDRARAQAMPVVEVVDLRRIGAGPTGDKRISLPLHRALEVTLARGEQAILFLNRRGFAPSVRCEACGEMCSCPSCSVALTFHKRAGGILRCHYCDFSAPLFSKCPKCAAPALALEGLGTEKLEETLTSAFPSARVARLDRDVASGKAIEKVIERVRAREVDILVGTQMVTKGHDLPLVTLVGVINADAALSLPDYRAAERAFQLMVQVAGRAGRGDAKGRVLVQTYAPEHHAIVFALQHDVDGFIERELVDRRELDYPPYSRMALLRFDAPDEAEVKRAAQHIALAVRDAAVPSVLVIGPAPAPIERIRGRYRYRVMLRSRERSHLRRALQAALAARADLHRSVRCSLDVDPVQLL